MISPSAKIIIIIFCCSLLIDAVIPLHVLLITRLGNWCFFSCVEWSVFLFNLWTCKWVCAFYKEVTRHPFTVPRKVNETICCAHLCCRELPITCISSSLIAAHTVGYISRVVVVPHASSADPFFQKEVWEHAQSLSSEHFTHCYPCRWYLITAFLAAVI